MIKYRSNSEDVVGGVEAWFIEHNNTLVYRYWWYGQDDNTFLTPHPHNRQRVVHVNGERAIEVLL